MSLDLPASLMREGFAHDRHGGWAFRGRAAGSGSGGRVPAGRDPDQRSGVGFLPRVLAAALVAWFAGGWAVERMAQFLAGAMERMSQHL